MFEQMIAERDYVNTHYNTINLNDFKQKILDKLIKSRIPTDVINEIEIKTCQGKQGVIDIGCQYQNIDITIDENRFIMEKLLGNFNEEIDELKYRLKRQLRTIIYTVKIVENVKFKNINIIFKEINNA